jgi:hypothetical protein
MSHDPMATPCRDFPYLTPTNHHIIGPATPNYNCIAWAAHDLQRWWQPGSQYYWPLPATDADCGVGDLVAAFQTLGFMDCEDQDLIAGFERIAIYARSQFEYTHAARQLPFGKWTSKLGPLVLIEHDTPQDVAGGLYGNIFQFMMRALPTS